ncbi:YHYH protein [Winogradskyella sp. PE311]|uniref:YHYH protein n=1 Tax=Winogradskyella sp. PE311 TaxID=3366943 RepID=UPI0039802B5B
MRYSILLLLVMACNSHKTTEVHSHDDIAHAHNDAQEVTSYFNEYTLNDKTYGTKTSVKIKGDKRIMTTNSLPNHKTGQFPNQGNPNSISAQERTFDFPLNPVYTGIAKWAREPGIALNGIKFEPGTAEVVVCDTGENYRVEALQEVIDLGLDFNHAHVQPTGAYHYHGTPTSVIENFDAGNDLVHVGFAHDGFPMYYSKSGKYKPSYKALSGNREGEDCSYENPHQSMNLSVGGHHDGTFTSDFEFIEGSGDLDECNGITINGKYMYLVTAEFPYVSRCLMGSYEEARPQGPGQGLNSRNSTEPNHRQGGRPSFSELLKMMDTNNDKRISKKEAKGPLSEDFDKIDKNKDGFLSEEEIQTGARSSKKEPEGRRPRN